MALLRHIHAWGPSFAPLPSPSSLSSEEEQRAALQKPDAASSAQAVLLLLSRLTKRHSIALKVGYPRLYLAPWSSTWMFAVPVGANLHSTLSDCGRFIANAE
jgi:hypothetical protein